MLYWYTYALNNPLRFVDPSGYKYGPSDYEREIARGEHTYYNWEMAWKLGGNRTPFASIMANSVTGGWHSTGGSGYYNRFTGQTMSGGDFLNNTPYLTSPEYVDYSPGAVANAVMGSKEMELLPGTDPLGSRMAIFTYASGKVSGGPVPFWEFTGSYYNDLYYFSGLVAFDTYKAKRELVASGASVDFTLALGPIGFSIEAGSIDYNEGVHRFFSIGSAIGLEASLSMNKINIREYPHNSFTPQNYAGWSTTTNHSLTYFTYGLESALQYTQSPYYKYGYNANQFSFGLGALPVAWSEVRAYTWVGKRRERYQYKFYDFK